MACKGSKKKKGGKGRKGFILLDLLNWLPAIIVGAIALFLLADLCFGGTVQINALNVEADTAKVVTGAQSNLIDTALQPADTNGWVVSPHTTMQAQIDANSVTGGLNSTAIAVLETNKVTTIWDSEDPTIFSVYENGTQTVYQITTEIDTSVTNYICTGATDLTQYIGETFYFYDFFGETRYFSNTVDSFEIRYDDGGMTWYDNTYAYSASIGGYPQDSFTLNELVGVNTMDFVRSYHAITNILYRFPYDPHHIEQTDGVGTNLTVVSNLVVNGDSDISGNLELGAIADVEAEIDGKTTLTAVSNVVSSADATPYAITAVNGTATVDRANGILQTLTGASDVVLDVVAGSTLYDSQVNLVVTNVVYSITYTANATNIVTGLSDITMTNTTTTLFYSPLGLTTWEASLYYGGE